VLKVRGLAVELAEGVGVDAAMAEAAQAAFRAAVEEGFGEQDDASIVQWNRRRSRCP
jgi:3-hydroxyisobutyrate dehydrogenase-like beta-hydroxyacid dehydrogenase